MTVLRFDEAELVAALERLPWRLRVVFAAACAERGAPSYAAFSSLARRGNPAALDAFLSRLWEDLAGTTPMGTAEVEAQIEECMELWDDDDPWFDGQAQAQDAVAAVDYAFRCRRGGESQEAAWAARRVFEAITDHVTIKENIDTNMEGGLARVLSHPLVQAELSRQRRDLDTLLQADPADVQRIAVQLRERARREGATVFHRAP